MPFIERNNCLIKEYINPDDPVRADFVTLANFRNGTTDLFVELADWAGVYDIEVIELFIDACRQVTREGKFVTFLKSLDNLIASYGEPLVISTLSPDCILPSGRIGRRAFKENLRTAK